MQYKMCILILLSLTGIGGCKWGGNQAGSLDTPTGGNIRIVADEALQPLVEAEIQAFQAIYRNAEIEAVYMPEAEAVQYLLQDSARLAILGRKLLPEERYALDTQKIVPQEVKAATDAVAFILHPSNPDTLLTYGQLVQLLRGEIRQWQQINAQSALPAVQVVFDHAHSGTVRWMMDSLASVERLPAHCFAVDHNEAVIQYVSHTPQAIGIIGLSWISDKDDTVTHRFLQQIKVAGIHAETAEKSAEYFQPYQAYLAQKKYPFTRDIYIISREARAGLGSGFTAFFCGDKGQRVVLKSGLVPATMPVRIVQLVSSQN